MFYSLICRALFPRALRLLISRISAFREYSIFFVEDDESHRCFVQTWNDHILMSVCVWVEPVGQIVPKAELSGLSRIIDSTTSCQLPLSCHGGSLTLMRVLSENRIDNRSFIVYREFSVDVFLHCFRLAYQETIGGLEVTTMADFLVLRLRGALQESWLENATALRRCVAAGRVPFNDLCGVVRDLISVWRSVRKFIKESAPRQIKTEADRVIRFNCIILDLVWLGGFMWSYPSLLFYFSFFLFFRLVLF